MSALPFSPKCILDRALWLAFIHSVHLAFVWVPVVVVRGPPSPCDGPSMLTLIVSSGICLPLVTQPYRSKLVKMSFVCIVNLSAVRGQDTVDASCTGSTNVSWLVWFSHNELIILYAWVKTVEIHGNLVIIIVSSGAVFIRYSTSQVVCSTANWVLRIYALTHMYAVLM